MVSPSAVARAIGAPESVVAWQDRADRWHRTYAGTPVTLTFDTATGSVQRTRMSMKLASRVCEDWAGLLWGEDAHITGNQLVDDAMTEAFSDRLLQHIEGTMALGTGALEVIADMDVSDSGEITRIRSVYVDTCETPNIYPLEWSRGEVTAVALVSFDTDDTFTARVHRYDPLTQRGTVTNRRFRAWGMGARELPLEDGVVAEYRYQGPPMFAVWTPAVRNAAWPKGPFGVSILDRPLDTLDVLDNAFDNLNADIVLGRKMVMLPDTMLKRDVDGNPIPPQRDRTQLFVSYSDATGEGGKPVEFNPSLRVGENTEAVDMAISLVGEMVGMGSDRYRYRSGQVATATQVIAEQSSTYRQRAKHLKALEPALLAIGACVSEIGVRYLGLPREDVDVVTDDSVIIDDTSRYEEGRMKFASGLLSLERYLREYERLSDEEIARELERLGVAAVATPERTGDTL